MESCHSDIKPYTILSAYRLYKRLSKISYKTFDIIFAASSLSGLSITAKGNNKRNISLSSIKFNKSLNGIT